MAFLDQVKNFDWSSLFGGASGTVAGVDIGSSSIKVVQLSKKNGGAVLDTYGELSLGPYANKEVGRSTKLPPNTVAEALGDITREAEVSADSAGFSIPYASSLASVVEMPNVEDKELDQIVPLEARKYIPVPIKEVSLDWFVIPNEQKEGDEHGAQQEQANERIKVMLVAIHNETLNDYQSIVNASPLEVDFYEIEIFSAIRSALPVSGDDGPSMVIDLGAATSKAYIVQNGIIRLSHIINRGSQDITLALSRSHGMSVEQAERLKREEGLSAANKNVKESIVLTLDYIFSEANRVLLNYEQQHHKSAQRIVLTGGGALLSGITENAKKHLERDVEIARPFASIETPAYLDDVVETAGPSFSVAAGLALRRLSELE